MENNNNSKVVYIENSMSAPDSNPPQTPPVAPADDKPPKQTTGLMGDIGSTFNDAIGFNGNTKNVGSIYNEQIGSTFSDRIGYNSSEEDDKHREDTSVPSKNSFDEKTVEEEDGPLILGGDRRRDGTDDDTCSEAGTHTDTESSICSKDIMEIDPFVVRLKMFLATDDGKSITTVLQDVLCELKKLNNNLEKK